MKTQSQPRDVLAELRLTLGRLNRTGDFSHPTIANLRRIIVQRIAELESAENSPPDPVKTKDTGKSDLLVMAAGAVQGYAVASSTFPKVLQIPLWRQR